MHFTQNKNTDTLLVRQAGAVLRRPPTWYQEVLYTEAVWCSFPFAQLAEDLAWVVN